MVRALDILSGTGFFRGALPEAAFWGLVALTVGIAGLTASLILVMLHFRDQSSLKRGQRNPSLYRAPKWGPLSHSLGEFFADPIHNAPLSPDAAAEYIIGRLEATRDATQAAVRYFSYAPLLFGLMGTIFALRALLVIQGNTLQQIQPHLAGVFAGTLAGIIGSLLAAVGGLALDWTSLSTINRAQDFIHRYILPTLPERRIAVRIEDAVLALIAEKAQAVALSFGKSIQPVATQMEQIVERCSKAAEVASNALAEAAHAVREAGDLEVASRNFKSGAHMIDSSAEQLSDATKQTAEVILRVGEIRQSLSELLGSIRETAENLDGTSTRLGNELASRLMELNKQGERLQATACILHPAIEALSTELMRRASSDSAHLDAIRGHIETTSRSFATVTTILQESSNELKTVPTRIEAIGGTIADGLRQGVTTGMDHITDHTTKKLDDVVLILERSAGALSKAFNEAQQRAEREVVITSPDLAAAIRQAADEMRKASEVSRRVAEVLLQVRPTGGEGGPKTREGFFRRLWG